MSIPAGTCAASTALSCLILSERSSAHAALKWGWPTDLLTADGRQRGIWSLLSQSKQDFWLESKGSDESPSRTQLWAPHPWVSRGGQGGTCQDGQGNASTHILLGLPIKLHSGKAGEGSGGSTSPYREWSPGRMDMGLTKVYWYYKDLWEYRWEMYVAEVITN